jgi:peptide/nickel transport system permease protein
MSDTTTSGDRLVATNATQGNEEYVLAVMVNAPDVAVPTGVAPAAIVGRSPGQLAWLRLRRDRSVIFSASTLLVLFILGVGAPLWSKLYGQDPLTTNPDLLSFHGGAEPLGVNGGMSGTHWLGIEPGLGRDILMQLIYGLRTSLGISIAAAILTTVLGVLFGIISGYATGWLAAVINWFIDFILAFPFLIFSLAAIPIIVNRFYGDSPTEPWWFRVSALILVLAFFGWPYTARIVRGQVLSLREREFVEAARAAGAGVGHMLFRQLLPNLWAPIIVVFSLSVPQLITSEAALSYLQIGVVEPTPDLGRMIATSTDYLQSDPWFTMLPGITILLLVFAFNLLGDSVRDALDPKSSR